MTIVEPVASSVRDERVTFIQWGPVIAGAVAAAAISLVLHAFAGAIGLAVSSTAPTWRDSSAVLHVLSGLYLVLVAMAAFGIGGYIAGRARAPLGGTEDEVEFRDGTHGLVVWALAMLLTAILTLAMAQSLARFSAPSGGQAGSTQSVAGESIVAYDLDRLFRSPRRDPNQDLTYPRSEAARILLASTGHTGLTSDDRAYLIQLTAANTGLALPEAERRVDTVVAQARDNIRKGRRSGVILAFAAGAAALLGAAVAWFAACAGGKHRDDKVPSMTWRGVRAVRIG